MKEFKVGHKVCTNANGNGVVNTINSAHFLPLIVMFSNGACISFSSDGRLNYDDINPTLYHGHDLEFIVKKPEYEWIWVYQDALGGFCITHCHHSDKSIKIDYRFDDTFIKIEQSKRKVQS